MMTTQQPVHVVGIGGTLHTGSHSLAALRRSLQAAEAVGATTDLLDLYELDLPLYRPGLTLADFPPQVTEFVERARQADAMLWSTAAYHGTLAGVTKNALDYAEFLSSGDRPYFQDKVVGLIATAGGDQADINSINAMVNIVHSLRGTAAPLSVPIHKARNAFDGDGNVTDPQVADRLDKLGVLVVETAARFRQVRELPVHLLS